MDIDALFGLYKDDKGAHIDSLSRKRCCYLNSAGRTILASPVYQEGVVGLSAKLTPWRGMGSDDVADVIRQRFGRLINAPATSIAIVPTTSFAMSLAAANIAEDTSLNKGDTIVVLGDQMGSNVLPWQNLCKKKSLKLKVVPNPSRHSLATETWTAAILKAIDRHVRIVAIPVVHWGTGVQLDVIAICRKLRQVQHGHSSYFVIDGTQSIGALEFDVQAIGADFVACSVHKWLCGAYGTSLMYVHPKFHRMWQPFDQHEKNRLGSDDVYQWDEVGAMSHDGFPTEFMHGARRFDAGGRPNPILHPMLAKALELVLAWSPTAVRQHTAVLSRRLHDKINDHAAYTAVADQLRLCQDHSDHLVGLLLPTYCDASRVANLLQQRGIYLSVRAGALRIAFFLYNNVTDVDYFVDNLIEIVCLEKQKFVCEKHDNSKMESKL
eukprot:m.99191 g.99191  ORF g.99191 m.99191 type:complete len:437 (-) comp27136_c0_seq1:96-1406(-)